MRTRTSILPTATILASVVAGTASAVTRPVPGDYADIAAALAAAAAGDEVVVAAGTYLEHDLTLPSGVVLRGATENPADVVIDAGRAGRCVYGTGLDAATRLEALTLSNGLPAEASPNPSWGGGLFVDVGALTVANCVFAGNEAAIGGGAHVVGTGEPAFIDCIFNGNEATESAGLLLRGVCSPLIVDSIFRNGTRCLAGGALTWAGSGLAQLVDCTVEDNSVWESGGGVEVLGPRAVANLRDCVIRRNAAGLAGGGLSVGLYGRVILERSVISGNSAADHGGGICLDGGAVLTAVEATILDNAAPAGSDGYVGSSSAATLNCCGIAADAWFGPGQLIVTHDNCAVAGEPVGWGEVKAMFR